MESLDPRADRQDPDNLDPTARAERAERKAREAFAELKAALEREKSLQADLALVATGTDGVWRWQGDGHDHPESMSAGLAVVMSAETLRSLVAERPVTEGDIAWLIAQTAAGPERERIIEALRVRSAELDALEVRRENARFAEARVQEAAARGVYYHWTDADGSARCGVPREDFRLGATEQKLSTCPACLAITPGEP